MSDLGCLELMTRHDYDDASFPLRETARDRVVQKISPGFFGYSHSKQRRGGRGAGWGEGRRERGPFF